MKNKIDNILEDNNFFAMMLVVGGYAGIRLTELMIIKGF